MSGAVATEQRPSIRWLFLVIAVLLAASIGVQVKRDRGWEPYVPDDQTLWIQSGPMASRLSLGFDSLVADVYWMRAVIYFGDKHRADGRLGYALLNPLLELVTTLDPHFRVAYRLGAIFLTEAHPAAARPDLAIQLLERGIEHDQPRWEYYHDIGFVYYWWLHDYQKAAEWFSRGAEQPGAADWLRPLAATTLAYGGDRQSSRLLWTQLMDAADSDWMRSSAEHRLRQLDALDAIDRLASAVQQFEKRAGRRPRNWEELAAAERLSPQALVDPTGVPFVVNPETGRLDVSRESTLWPLPIEPAARQTP